MGPWGYVFAAVLLPVLAMSMASRQYALLAFIMGLKWICFTIPFRSNFNLTENTEPYYFIVVASVSALAMTFLCRHHIAARIIFGLLVFSIFFAYIPLSAKLITTHASMVISEVIAYTQIIVMFTAAGGVDFVRDHRGVLASWFGDNRGSGSMAFRGKGKSFGLLKNRHRRDIRN